MNALSILRSALREWARNNPAQAKSDDFAEAESLVDLLDEEVPPWDGEDEFEVSDDDALEEGGFDSETE